jgi:Ca2+-binding EF-hand superfamily protein/endonuclease/exonuclease/phosphatase family metal-dependent hydrolase
MIAKRLLIALSTMSTTRASFLERSPAPNYGAMTQNDTKPISFRAAQYNILASYLGSNTEPWFLYGGLTGSDDNRAEEIAKKHRERDAEGNYKNVGWPNYVRDILSPEEISEVERNHRKHFDWKVRAPKIVQTIQDLDADVLSLVELDRYHEFFQAELDRIGLDSVWAKRPPRPASLDGCAVCWKKSKFELVANETLTYSDNAEGSRKDRVALVTLLRMRSSPHQQLIFVSTHFARNPECHRQMVIRQRQGVQLMLCLKSFAIRHGCKPEVPAILAGDFNAENFQEMRALTAAFFSLRNEIPEKPPLFWVMKDTPTLPTSFTLLRQMRIDYLVHSEIFLRLERVNSPKKGEAIQDGKTTIPNDSHPSDHLPVSAEFRFLTEQEVVRECADRFCTAILHPGAADRPPFQSEVRMAFEYFDQNITGSVSAEALTAGLRSLQDAATEEEHQMFREILLLLCAKDDKKRDIATADTFQNAMTNRFSTLLRSQGSEDPLWIERAFHHMDTNDDGLVSREEFTTSFGAMSETPETAIPNDELNRIFNSIDTNQDDKIQLEEFDRI